MRGIREERRKFRGALHERLAESVTVTVSGTDIVITGLTARIHDENRLVGDVKGTSLDFAEIHENTPYAVFRVSQFNPENQSFVESGISDFKDVLCRGTVIRAFNEDSLALAYEISDIEPVHGITINVNLTRLSQRKACDFPEPVEDPLCPPNT